MAEINIEKMAQNVAQKAMQGLRDDGAFVSRWIPVSERLPEVEYGYSDFGFDDEPAYDCFSSDRVLVSYIKNETKERGMCVSRLTVWKYEDGKKEVSWDSVDFDYEDTNRYNPNIVSSYDGFEVIAWMPLPKPYKEAERVEELPTPGTGKEETDADESKV